MKNLKKIFLGISLILFFVFIVIVAKNIILINTDSIASYSESSDETFKKTIYEQDIINISKCSEDFMNQYFEEITALNESISKEDEETQKEMKSNMLIVTSKEENINSYGATQVIKAPNNQFILAFNTKEEKDQALANLNSDKSILDVDENNEYTLTISNISETENTQAAYNSWGVEKSGLDVATSVANNKSLEEVTVAIIDSGCNLELLEENFPGKISGTYDLFSNSGEFDDQVGHGTHIAGTIAESTPNNVKIFPVKVSNTRTMYNTDIISAINYIVYNDVADVINMSFGSYHKDESMYTAITAANDNNIICVAAAGNDNISANSYPASYENTLSIAACTENLEKASFSNYNNSVTFTAPGENILSVNGTMSGTSMATPHVVSDVAILKSYNKNYTLDNTIDALKKYCIDLGIEGKDKEFGYGFVYLKDVVYCTCNCENCDEIYCLGCECDSCSLEDSTLREEKVNKIEVVSPVIRLDYNYGSLTNLSQVMLKIYYDDYTKEVSLLELEDCEITGYDPYCYENQTITVKYKEQTTTFELNVGEAYEYGWSYELNGDNTIKLTEFKDTVPTINVMYIPETIDGYKVTELGDELFYTKGEFYKIIIPTCINKIGNKCFCNNVDLKYVEWLAEEKYIGNYAFYSCDVLESSFNGIKQLGDSAFYECKKIKEVEFSNSIESIGNNAFFYCISLEELVLPDSITTIGSYAFASCLNLSKVNIPSNIKEIGNYAFSYTAITTATIPEEVTTIKEGTFNECNNLENLTLPDNLTNIETKAFYECSNLTSLQIPKGVTSICEDSFLKCSNLTSISVDSENFVYDSREDCDAIIEKENNKLVVGSNNTLIPETVKIIGKNAFDSKINLYSLDIPEGVTTIEDKAFNACIYLQALVLPKSVISITSDAFNNCSNLTMYVYKESYSKEYAVENDITHEYIDKEILGVSVLNLSKRTYTAFEKVDTTGLVLRIVYDDKTFVDITYGYEIKYETGNDSFRYGDTKFTISYDSSAIVFSKEIEVTVNKAIPEYTIPTGLKAKTGQKLSDITLPDGFEWMDESLIIEEVGNINFKAKFIPEDTVNYETINDIEVTVEVTKSIPVEITEVCGINTSTYTAFDKVNIEDMYIKVLYDAQIEKDITENISIEYSSGNDSFRYGDTKYTVVYIEDDVKLTKDISVTVGKSIPEYTIPTGLEAKNRTNISRYNFA